MQTPLPQAAERAAALAPRPLSLNDGKTLALAALGGALEFYDFIIFVFFTAEIGVLFFPPSSQPWLRDFRAYGLLAAGYLARPLGGIIMAHFGDRTGRKRMFALSVFLMALPTLLMGALPTYATAGYAAPLLLLLLRILQGAAVGGEVPGAWVFVSEHVPARRVCFACGTLTSGLTFGILLGSLMAGAVRRSFTPAEVLDFGWRVPFLIGGVLGFFSVFLRRWLSETPVFEEMRARRELIAEMPLKAVLRNHGGAVVVSLLLTWVITAGIVVVILMTPTILPTLYGIPPADALKANSIATLCLTCGCITFGLLADKIGAGRVLAFGCVFLTGATYLLYQGLQWMPDNLVGLYALAGFAVGVVGVVPSVMVRVFPPAVRFSGLSFSYNMAYAVFGGITPLIVPLMIKKTLLGPAIYVGIVGVFGTAVGLYLLSTGRARFHEGNAG